VGLALESDGTGTGLLLSPPSRPEKVSESKSSQAANFHVVTFSHCTCRWRGTTSLLQEEHRKHKNDYIVSDQGSI